MSDGVARGTQNLRERLVKQALADALTGSRAEREGVLLALDAIRTYENTCSR